MTGIYRRKWIPAFAGMTAGRREFGGQESDGGGRRNSTKKRRNSAKNPPQFPPKTRKTPRHSRRKQEKSPVIPAKAGIHYGRLILEFPRVFFVKNGVNAGICRRKWIPAFAGMTAGRREFVGENRTAAGDSDLHRNGKSWKLGKKNLPFRRTPESLREIPIYIGMEKVGN